MSARRSHGVFETCAGHFRCFHLRDLCPTPRCCQNFGIRYAGRSRPTPRAAGAVLGVLCIAGRAGKRPLIQGGTRQGQPNHCPPISVCATQNRHAIPAMGRSGAYLCGARAGAGRFGHPRISAPPPFGLRNIAEPWQNAAVMSRDPVRLKDVSNTKGARRCHISAIWRAGIGRGLWSQDEQTQWGKSRFHV